MRGRVSATTRMFSALCAVFVSGLLFASCGNGVPGNAVARVGDYVISKSLFNHWMQIAANSSAGQVPGQAASTQVPQPPDFKACIAQKRSTAPKPAAGQPQPSDVQFKAQCQQQYQGLRDQVMQFLISSDWIQGESADQGIKVSAADAQKQLTAIKAQQFPTPAAFAKFLATSGMNMNDLLFRVRLDALSNKLRTKITKGKGTVTDAQIASYYAQNKSRFAQPERRDLRIVLAKTPAVAQAALKAIRSHQSFSTVAKKYSIDQASKSQGGVLLGVAKGQQEQALDTAVFAAKPGVLTGPVKTQFGYYVFRVQKITPASQQTLAQVSATIKQQLATMNQQTALTAFVKIFRKKWTSRTNCRTGFIVQSCKNAPKVPATPGLVQGGGAAGGASGAPPAQSGAPPGPGRHPRPRAAHPAPQGGAPPPRAARPRPERRASRPRGGSTTTPIPVAPERVGPGPDWTDEEPMSQIETVHARQILDSRGNPTVEVEVTLRSGATGDGPPFPRAPRRASSRPPSCATAARPTAARGSRAPWPTSTARSPRPSRGRRERPGGAGPAPDRSGRHAREIAARGQCGAGRVAGRRPCGRGRGAPAAVALSRRRGRAHPARADDERAQRRRPRRQQGRLPGVHDRPVRRAELQRVPAGRRRGLPPAQGPSARARPGHGGRRRGRLRARPRVQRGRAGVPGRRDPVRGLRARSGRGDRAGPRHQRDPLRRRLRARARGPFAERRRAGRLLGRDGRPLPRSSRSRTAWTRRTGTAGGR